MKVDQTNLPDGINNRLLDYLLSSTTTECICGNPLCSENIAVLKRWQELLPPKSYALLYHDFVHTAQTWGQGYDPSILTEIIEKASQTITTIDEKEEQIFLEDEKQRKSPDISDLVEARLEAEHTIQKMDDKITFLETELKKANIYLNDRTKIFNKLTEATIEAQKADRRIQIMQLVKKNFSEKLENASTIYSERLQAHIQALLDRMLNAVRIVTVTPEFSVTITDPSGKIQAKSGGQFAVASFAFIGGIYKLLQSIEDLNEKDFPLVLDAPFSKLDDENEPNVIKTVPTFAPQLILFCKDSLEDKFDPSVVGKKWTIMSNAEKNISIVKEGYWWN